MTNPAEEIGVTEQKNLPPPTGTREIPSSPSGIETIADLEQYLLASGFDKESIDIIADKDKLLVLIQELKQFPLSVAYEPHRSRYQKIATEMKAILKPLLETKDKKVTKEGNRATQLINSMRALVTANGYSRLAGHK